MFRRFLIVVLSLLSCPYIQQKMGKTLEENAVNDYGFCGTVQKAVAFIKTKLIFSSSFCLKDPQKMNETKAIFG